jgi:Na+/H+ antiporter NhaD/arsenite permease-like protein
MTFIAVIVVIMFEWLHITVAALLGALILVFTHIMTLQEAVGYISRSYATLALFFGVMVLVRAFEPTKIFDYLAAQMVLLAKGQGKLLLIGIVAITTPICAVAQRYHGHVTSTSNSPIGTGYWRGFCATS